MEVLSPETGIILKRLPSDISRCVLNVKLSFCEEMTVPASIPA